MKIGIITFHWATNYGAVLQAYALQLFLTKLGHDVKIIDYVPGSYEKNFIKCFFTKRPWLIKKNILEFYKERRFINFREKKFNLTDRYSSMQELKLKPPECDVYICGSDQIWNPSFTAGGEGQTTTSYFLDFGNEKTRRIAYAVSFGCTEYLENIKRIVTPLLSKFNAISVREKTGCEIVRSMGFDNVSIMPDPTLLLSAKEYDENIDGSMCLDNPFSFFYVIHNHQCTIKRIEDYFRDKLSENIISTYRIRYSMIGINKWFSLVKDAKTIVTNSYHGIIFSIIYKKQFIAVPVEGALAGMNDRIFTLLEQLGLQDRIVNNCEPSRITSLLSEPINWNYAEEKIQNLRIKAELFIAENVRTNLIDEYQTKKHELLEVRV